jgi:hypothetical protein
MDDRTDEQRTADDALHEAIQAVARAYCLPEDAFITDWVVVGHALRASDDGDRHHDFTLLPENGLRMSQPMGIGLLHTALLRAERDYLGDNDAG